MIFVYLSMAFVGGLLLTAIFENLYPVHKQRFPSTVLKNQASKIYWCVSGLLGVISGVPFLMLPALSPVALSHIQLCATVEDMILTKQVVRNIIPATKEWLKKQRREVSCQEKR